MGPVNAFSVDVEDYYHVSGFAGDIDHRTWGDFESRVVANTHRVLRLLDRRQVPATFFVLGWVARRFPGLVRDIQRSGHELGSHSYWHRLVYDLTPDAFRRDLVESRAAIEEAAGERVTAYRAPSFSITKRSLWALDILAAEGFLSDSSIFPIYHDRYGMPGAEPFLHRRATSRGALWEFPPSVARVGRLNLPVSGGGYFRLYPLRLTLRSLASINRRGEPFMFYIHPWELDPDQPRLALGSRLCRARHYVNLRTTERKLDRLLGCFQFGRLSDTIRAVEAEVRQPARPVPLPA